MRTGAFPASELKPVAQPLTGQRLPNVGRNPKVLPRPIPQVPPVRYLVLGLFAGLGLVQGYTKKLLPGTKSKFSTPESCFLRFPLQANLSHPARQRLLLQNHFP